MHNEKLTGSKPAACDPVERPCWALWLKWFDMGKKAIEMAEQQLTGFAAARAGESIESLAGSMGLTASEWDKIKSLGNVLLSRADEEALDGYFR